MSIYALAHIIHVYCAIAFVGGVFFEMLVLSVLHTGRVSRESRREVERAMSYRAVRVMPPVVITLFISGIVMVYNRYLPILHHPFDSSFGIMLSIKILLAVSVLVHFAIAVVKWHGTPLPSAGRNTYTPSYSAICCLSSFLPKQCSTCLGKPYPYPTHKDCL